MSRWAFRMAAKHLGADEVGSLVRVEVSPGLVIQDRIIAVSHGAAIPRGAATVTLDPPPFDIVAAVGVVLNSGRAPSGVYVEFEHFVPRVGEDQRRVGGLLLAPETVVRFA